MADREKVRSSRTLPHQPVRQVTVTSGFIIRRNDGFVQDNHSFKRASRFIGKFELILRTMFLLTRRVINDITRNVMLLLPFVGNVLNLSFYVGFGVSRDHY